MATLIKTPQGSTFDLNKPARASHIKIIKDNYGNTQMDELKFTGKTNTYIEDKQEYTEFEMEHSFGKDYVSELLIIQ